MNDYEKVVMGLETFGCFCEQFDYDIYAQILLEELLDGIIHEETVFVFGEQEQTGDQDDHGSSIGIDCDQSSEGSVNLNVATDLGTEDISNYP